eukprot:CAMPEP_0194274148 /NCGR_PEP_ID=MMETSP0169-20130528/7295_1 /TAXON_ID=218684 /ORGANISM="Corethron pennatum, Strain L29A3" /LENGTH=379 /DNA_ID=CAMNT_0039017269 /DNA_START=135 /DNA_END=1274 /DNA_ORIENTATION=-
MAANSVNAAEDKFPPNSFWAEVFEQVTGKLQDLDRTTPGLLQTLVDGNVIYDDPSFMTMQALFGVYRTGLVGYSSCENEKFGKDGEHTDLICEMERVRDEIFSTDEQLPVHKDSSLKPFQAAKPSLFEDEEKMARAYCEEFFEVPAKKCPDSKIKQFLPSIRYLQDVVKSFVPDGYNNPLFSYGIGLSDQNVFNTRSNFLWGDGFFKMLEIVLEQDAFVDFKCANRICLMEGLVLSFNINAYIQENTRILDNNFAEIDEDDLGTILSGYLYQRQSKQIHPKMKDRQVMIKVFAMRHKCYYFTGLLISELCGLGITETLEVIDKLNIGGLRPGEKCPIKPKLIVRVSKGRFSRGKIERKVKEVEKCVASLKRKKSNEKKL